VYSSRQLLEAQFTPSTPSYTAPFSTYTQKASTCLLREFLDAGRSTLSNNAPEQPIESPPGLVLDQWDDTERPGLLLATAGLAKPPERSSGQVGASGYISEQDGSLGKIAFCEARSKHMNPT
jgi:hypothetical protein